MSGSFICMHMTTVPLFRRTLSWFVFGTASFGQFRHRKPHLTRTTHERSVISWRQIANTLIDLETASADINFWVAVIDQNPRWIFFRRLNSEYADSHPHRAGRGGILATAARSPGN